MLFLLGFSGIGLAALDHYAASDTGERRKDGASRAVAATPARAASAVRPALLRELEALKVARGQAPGAELFPAKSWQPPPPPPAPPPPPPPPPAPVAPVAPPLPFVFMGRMFDADPPTVFLVKGERAYLVAQGEVIDDIYRLEKVEPGQLTLRYLPLDAVQTLPVGEKP
ncbi:hypothetical protein GCM10028796_44030 [Ramlibacter monticola]